MDYRWECTVKAVIQKNSAVAFYGFAAEFFSGNKRKIIPELFTELFRGNTSVYGLHIPEKTTTKGVKAKGQSFTKSEPVTHELYEKHCAGTQSLGIVPIDQNNNVRFMAIDVDTYPLDPKRYC